MFVGWPENAYALRYLQEYVRGAILAQNGHVMDDPEALGLGDLVIISQSAHIYEDCWASAKNTVASHRGPEIWFDEKGQWIIEPRADGKVDMELCDPNGLSVLKLAGTPIRVMKEIRDRRLISDVGHALWLGLQIGINGMHSRLSDLEALWHHVPGDVKANARQKVHLEKLKEKKDEEENRGEETDEAGA
jgi:thymidylate synthase